MQVGYGLARKADTPGSPAKPLDDATLAAYVTELHDQGRAAGERLDGSGRGVLRARPGERTAQGPRRLPGRRRPGLGAAVPGRRTCPRIGRGVAMTKLVDDCPRCGAGHITFNLLNATSVLRNGEHVLEAFCVCQHCRQATIFELRPIREVDLSSIDGSVNNYVQILGYISIADFNARSSPAHLPNPIAAAFEEGAKCVAVGCFNAAAAMFRLSLDLATKELLPTDKTQGPNEHITRRLALEPLAKLLGLSAWRSPQFSW